MALSVPNFIPKCDFFSGGKHSLPAGLPAEYYQGFQGCLKKVKIFRKKLDLMRHGGHGHGLGFCGER